MSKKSLTHLPKVFLSDKEITDFIYKEHRRGNVRKLVFRLYTKNLKTICKH